MNQKELIIASACSSAGIGMEGYKRAGFVPAYALEIEAEPAAIFDANHRYSDGSSIMNVKSLYDVTGQEVLAQIKAKTGSDKIHLFELGPSCQDFTKLKTSGVDRGRNQLMLEALRLIDETQPEVAIIEEVPDFLYDKFKEVSEPYFARVNTMGYQSAYMTMNTIHYGSNQSRKRFIHMFVRADRCKSPVFPTPNVIDVKRVKDFLDIDHFFSGHFSDTIKNKNHFMCTVTSGSPTWFAKDGIKYPPTIEELCKCMDLPSSFKMLGPVAVQKLALGNGIPAALTYQLGRTIIQDILELKRTAKDVWVPR